MLRLIICYVTLLFIIIGTYAGDSPKNDMIVFGDSYTADDNDVCNGPKWIRELGNTWNNVSIQNFAVGGACCSKQKHSPSPSVTEQADSYLQSNPKTNSDTAIYSIFVGINDLVAGEEATDVVGCIESQITRLNSKVQGKRFMVFNMVPFDHSPRIMEGGEISNQTAAAWIQQFNQDLNAKMAEMHQQNPDLQIVIIDTHSTLDKVLNNPSDYGITNSADDYYTHLVPHPGSDASALLSDGNQFFWFNEAHITNTVHKEISKAIVELKPFSNLPVADGDTSSDTPSDAASIVQHRSFALLTFIVGVTLLL